MCDVCGSLVMSHMGVNGIAVLACPQCGNVMRKVDEREEGDLPVYDLHPVLR